MISFKSFIEKLLAEEFLTEGAKNKDDPTKVDGMSNDTSGKLHELLVGRALNNGEHMDKFESESDHPTKKNMRIRETPKQLHDRLRKQVHPADYRRAVIRAKVAADAIRAEAAKKGLTITKASHTSKPGDTEKITKIPATQTQDSSDIYYTAVDKKGRESLHGRSLKVTEDSNKNVPSSSLGMKSSGPDATKLYKKHQNKIKKDHPDLMAVKKEEHHRDIIDARKEWARNNPEKHKKIKVANRKLLASVAKAHATHLQDQLRNGNHEEVVNHIRNVLSAKKTPAQGAGIATFSKSTVYKTAKGYQHHSSDPSEEHEHILNDPKNISVTHTGSSVHFHYTDPKTGTTRKFATQAHKLDSQSDPLSGLKSAGRAV